MQADFSFLNSLYKNQPFMFEFNFVGNLNAYVERKTSDSDKVQCFLGFLNFRYSKIASRW